MSEGPARSGTPAWHGLLLYALVSVLWSWPLAMAPATSTTALHFDVFPAAWLAEAAPGFLPDGTSGWSAWPEGEPLQRIDSFLFLGVALLMGGGIPGMLLVNFFVLLGPVASAWAAERFARRALGVEGPAALVAGLCFGFAPIGLVAALEGHVYTLLDPWLPLCALAVWEGRARGAALHFALALLSTAYLGVAALLVAGAVAIARGPTLGRAPVARVLGGMGAVGVVYTALYLTGDGGPAREAGDAALLHALQDPKVNIAGIRRGDLLPGLEMFSPNRLSRHLRRLLDLGVIKRVTGTYRYYLTKAGRAATAAAEPLAQAATVPDMI